MAELVFVTVSDLTKIQEKFVEGARLPQWLQSKEIVQLTVNDIEATTAWDIVRRGKCVNLRIVAVPYDVWYRLYTTVIGGDDTINPGTISTPLTRASIGSPVPRKPYRKLPTGETIRPSPIGSTIADWVCRVACIQFLPEGKVAPNPYFVKQSNRLFVDGSGFKPSESVVVDFGTTANIKTVTTDEFGGFQTSYDVPAIESLGEKIIVATGQTSHVYAESIVEVIA